MEDKITFYSYVFVNTPLNFTEIRRHWLLHLTSTLFHLWPCRRNGWATNGTTGAFCLDSRQEQKTFRLSKAFRPTLKPICAPVKWVPEMFYAEKKRHSFEADHLNVSIAEVKIKWSCKSTLPYPFHGVQRDKCTLAFYCF